MNPTAHGDDAPRRMLRHLAGIATECPFSAWPQPVAALVEAAFDGGGKAAASRDALAALGIRIVRAGDQLTANGKPVSRRAAGDGMWFAFGARRLCECFAGTEFAAYSWIFALLQLPTAVSSAPSNIRVGQLVGPAVWLSRSDWPADSAAISRLPGDERAP